MSLLGEHRDGTFAEFVSVPARNVFALPEGWDDAEAAALGAQPPPGEAVGLPLEERVQRRPVCPASSSLAAALRACRRINDYAVAVRFLEQVRIKCQSSKKHAEEVYPWIIQEVSRFTIFIVGRNECFVRAGASGVG